MLPARNKRLPPKFTKYNTAIRSDFGVGDASHFLPWVRLSTAKLNPMPPPENETLIRQIHASGRQLVIAVTGGGSMAISGLLQVPGASATVLEAIVPYSAKSLDQWVGGIIEQYCSEKTARAMAVRAFERARELSAADAHKLIGIGATASLATNRPKRGAHRIHIARQSAAITSLTTCNFLDSANTRAEEENASTQLVLQAIAEACNIHHPPPNIKLGTRVTNQSEVAPREWSELLLGQRRLLEVRPDLKRSSRQILFPGAFNPPHWGHERMAEIAAQRYGGTVTFELSIINVDKPSLDFIEIAERLELLKERPVLLTRAPTFVEKAQLAPSCIFVVGADTIERIADPRYYDGDSAKRDNAIAHISDAGCRFLVFGRFREDKFMPASAVDIPRALRNLCDEVDESEFRADVSSSELRSDTMGSSGGADEWEEEH
jgi:nicotinamide mononucleotide (NMN) deamidase PncC